MICRYGSLGKLGEDGMGERRARGSLLRSPEGAA